MDHGPKDDYFSYDIEWRPSLRRPGTVRVRGKGIDMLSRPMSVGAWMCKGRNAGLS